MQFLVYLFIFLIGLAIAIGVYLGLTFTPIEALLSGVIASTLAIVLFEKTLRVRAEKRFEKGIEDLSRLLSTNAQAGQVLSKRMNKLSDIDADTRLQTMEADVSVLGTVVRQVAEAVAQLEEAQAANIEENNPANKQHQDITKEPKITIAKLKQALDDGRMIIYAQSIIALPQRQNKAYDLIPQMQLENGKMAKSVDFMPVSGNDSMIRRIDQLGFNRAFEYLENISDSSLLSPIYVPISRASLANSSIVEWIIAQLDISRELANFIILTILEDDYKNLSNKELLNLSAMVEKGAVICLNNIDNLRMDFAKLKQQGVSFVRTDANSFINTPEKYTDYQSSDIAPYVRRFGIDLIIDNVQSEQQILTLLEDGVGLILGDYILPPEPALSVLKPIKNIEQAAI